MHLQRDIIKYGLKNFEFIVVEFVPDITMLLDTEQKWFNWLFNLSRDFRYNFALPRCCLSKERGNHPKQLAEGLLLSL